MTSFPTEMDEIESSPGIRNILITGKPGVGKTTLVSGIVAGISHSTMGFYTAEFRQAGRRSGFKIATLCGKEAVLASTSIDSRWRVGRYGVDLNAFERLAIPELEKAIDEADLILIDEIGKMELFSDRFQRIVRRALDSDKVVLATVTRSKLPFAEQIKRREDVSVIVVTESNREELRDRITITLLDLLNEDIDS